MRRDPQNGAAAAPHRIRGKIEGTAARPRLAVYRSNQGIFAQVIDDAAGNTLAAASTAATSREGHERRAARARPSASCVAQRAKEAGVEHVVFDRGGYLYHGRVKALADGAREGGLKF